METILDHTTAELQNRINDLEQFAVEYTRLTESLARAGSYNPEQAVHQQVRWLSRKLESLDALYKACKNAVRIMRVHGTANMGFAIDECKAAIHKVEEI